MLPEQGLLSDCGNNYFQMNSCILAGSIQTTPQSNSNDYLTFNRGSQEERNQGTLTHPSEASGKSIQGRVLETNQPQGMQQSDLFKAEYVFIVDSEGEDEVTSRKGEQGPPGGTGNMAARPKSLAISSSLVSDVVRPKIRGTDLKSSSYSEISHGMASQQKHGQKTPPVPANLDGASVLEEFHTRRLDVSGALVEETATYFQTTAHSSPFSASKGASAHSSPFSASKGASWTLPFPHSTQLPGSNLSSPSAADQNPGLAPEVLKKTTPLTSNVLSPRESLKTTSPSPSSSASLKSNSASYIPVRIVMHSLSPSPKPLTSSFHGSSSTVCSQMSSSGNLSKSGVKSQVPSRLSLLTAILKSNPSHQRPVSPASCPTFSLNSLASSTLALDQKVKQTTLTPKKSLSSCSLRAQSPAQAEHQVSELAQQSFHLPFFTKSTPTSQVSSLSPTTPVNSSLVSMNVEKTPSPTSLKSGTMQTNASSFADLPPVPPSSSLSSSKNKQDGDLRGSENPRNTYTHPSTLASSALSSVSPPINHSTMPSSPEKCFHPSPALSNLIDRSKRASYKPSGQGLNPSALSSPALSNAGCASLPSLGSSSVPPAALPAPAPQLSPSTLHPNCGSGSLPSRMMKSESTKSNHMAPVSTPSLPISLTRTKELISPCALSLSTGPENKKPKALDEPAKTENVSKDSTLDLPVEHSSDSPSRSPQTLLGSETIKTSTTLPKAAGRETKYANLSSPSSTVSESQLTKPGVIRPVPVKSKILLKKEEEVYEPNPFSKYLEDNSDLFSEQDVTVPHKPVSLHPLYQTKLYPPAKSLLQPQTLPHADCLTPGPFSHLSSFSLSDEQENSHTLLSHNAYNKLSHPMVAIPEHETLDSKENECSLYEQQRN
uniref:muscular LMNA-interacting protein isoform X28 n=1 Tax=Ictidomys tridecemlineatus TaxID=43179 RepID=UPI001A9CBBF7|nr:muscular LMNA-interacting protein isoform X28 [Ictidomys tridecemlineatus]